MSVDISNQLRRGFIDGFKAFPKLSQLLALGPVGNVAKAVLAGSNAIIGAYGIGNTFGLNLFGVAAFLDSFRVDFFIALPSFPQGGDAYFPADSHSFPASRRISQETEGIRPR